MWNVRGEAPLVFVHVPLAGSYSSALSEKLSTVHLVSPPTTNTLPLGSRVAVWFSRALISEPVVTDNHHGVGAFLLASVEIEPLA